MIYRQKAKKPPKPTKSGSKTKTNMKNKIRGFALCALWYLSIISGFFILICPIIPLVVISPKKYRKWSDLIFGMWEPFTVAMMEIFFGIRVILTGDKVNPFEGSLFIMNHRTRVDWTFLWMALFHCCQPNAHNIKYVLKAPIMHTPGPGWVMQACSFIFVHRDWEKDKLLLDRMIDYLNESDQQYQILLFPEGTDLSENGLRKSHKYADTHNLERYYKVLHPRTTGFAFLVSKMKAGGHLQAVYDVTIAYPKTVAQNEKDLFNGKLPEEVHFNFKRYSSSDIPHDEEEIRNWLNLVWKNKEEKLNAFYAIGSFPEDQEISEYQDDYLSSENADIFQLRNGKLKKKQDILPEDFNPESSDKFHTHFPSRPGTSKDSEHQRYTGSMIGNHMSSENLYKSKNYRPSYLLYLVLVFWLCLITLAMYGLCYNFYLQIWVLVHASFFTALSFVSNGFHHIAADIYFYRCGRKPCVEKKSE